MLYFQSRKDLRRKSGFDHITFTFGENSNYWRESLPGVFQKFVNKAQQSIAFTTKANFPAEGEGDGIESRLPFKIFSTLTLHTAKVKMSLHQKMPYQKVFANHYQLGGSVVAAPAIRLLHTQEQVK